jgi:hypothetical protein
LRRRLKQAAQYLVALLLVFVFGGFSMVDPSDAKLDRLALSIGHFTINFAQLEAFLNINLNILHRLHGCHRLAKRSEFSRRVTAFRQGVSNANISAAGKTQGLGLASQMTAISDLRHTCTHGAIAFSDADDFDSLGVSFHRVSPDNFALNPDHRFVGEIDLAAKTTFQLSVKLLGFTAILDKRLVDRVNHTLRELIG